MATHVVQPVQWGYGSVSRGKSMRHGSERHAHRRRRDPRLLSAQFQLWESIAVRPRRSYTGLFGSLIRKEPEHRKGQLATHIDLSVRDRRNRELGCRRSSSGPAAWTAVKQGRNIGGVVSIQDDCT